MDPKIIAEHGLTDEEYQRILAILGREPNTNELGIFSAMWSEHCSYKSSRLHLKKLPTRGPHVLQGPGENAGVIDIGDGLALAFKMESHNHPSFIEPYQGAATGVGGILRDVFTMGARPIANLNALRFGNPQHAKTAHLLSGVVAGIAGYGNCMGIPTVGGEVAFEDCYNGNILVNAFTVGVLPCDKIFKGVAAGVGNPVIYIGSKTGRDGIHGATMASDVFDAGSASQRPTVQVGDPFREKLLLEACLELMATDSIAGIQDMGAAGLTSSSFEMADRAGTGIAMDLDRVPQREEGMVPYEILLSESQERMLLVARKGHEKKVQEIFQKWDLDAVVVGEVTDDGRMRMQWHGETVVDLPIKPLSQGSPLYDRPQMKPPWQDERQQLFLSDIKMPKDLGAVLQQMLAQPNLASKHWVWEQYDHMVMTNTVVCPGSDAAIVRLKGTNKGVGLTVNCNSRYCFLDPKLGAMIAVAQSARNLVCSGARPLAVTDCLNFGNPERAYVMYQFVESIAGIAQACQKLATPVVSGNVSFYNETSGEGIFPTPMIAMVGLIEPVARSMTQWFKQAGDLIGMIGQSRDELGGSEYLKIIHGCIRGLPPQIDWDQEVATHQSVLELVHGGLIHAAHDVSDGGLAVALSEMCFGQAAIGAEVQLAATLLRPDVLLFGESQGRVLVAFDGKNLDRVQEVCGRHQAPFEVIGRTGGDRLRISWQGSGLDLPLERLYGLWAGGLARGIFGKD